MSDSYIVTFREGVDITPYIEEVNNNGGQVTHIFTTVLNGFSAIIPSGFVPVLQELGADDGILIEEDGIVTIT
ncbi:proteinase propeptide [Moniliophthora roreri MCA 2997]|uniref:Proteinase propeptide n=2 Tax=Moniliophthora roreri TaxID=221103 RepID=V2WUH7_MONRO|nr:proteinase propeptide [Moniliophthora roreri MCA 2997]